MRAPSEAVLDAPVTTTPVTITTTTPTDPSPVDPSLGFTPAHVKYLHDRGVPLRVARDIGARSMTPAQVAAALNREASTLATGGLGLPYTQDPSFYRVRLDAAHNGAKFLTPGGLPVRPYIPPACAMDPSILKNIKVPLVFVEGPWKALALAAAGIPTIGLAGCSAGGHDVEKRRGDQVEVLHPDLVRLVKWEGRTVIIMMDAGRAWNPDVLFGENLLANCLHHARAKVLVAQLPPKDGVPRADQGPDDFLVAHGVAAIQTVIKDATKWRRPKVDSDQGDFALLVKEIRGTQVSGKVALENADGVVAELGFSEMLGLATLGTAPIIDADIAAIRLRLSEMGMAYRAEDIWTACNIVARDRPYHPVRDYLTGPTWDGERRVDLVCEEILHVVDADDDDNPAEAKTEAEERRRVARALKRRALQVRMFRCFLLSAVRRALYPGCKVDTALVLKGPQGAMKSTFFRTLAGPNWFCDSDLDIGDQQTTPMILGNAWICEWPELENLKRAREQTQVKAFMSRAEDLYRPPYGRTVVKHPRSSVIVGTTNDDSILTDATGNRRWHVLEVGGTIDSEKLLAWRDQLWAEIVHAEKSGEPHWLTDEEGKLLAEMQQRYTVDHPWTESIVEWLHTNKCSSPMLPVTVAIILEEAVCKQPGHMTTGDNKTVGDILKRIGWSKARRRVDGRQLYIWSPPESWEWRTPAPPFDVTEADF